MAYVADWRGTGGCAGVDSSDKAGNTSYVIGDSKSVGRVEGRPPAG
jgi:hypothetical protein